MLYSTEAVFLIFPFLQTNIASQNVSKWRRTDGQTDRRTDGIVISIADRLLRNARYNPTPKNNEVIFNGHSFIHKNYINSRQNAAK